ncbi:MAG TPA: membrane protein insertion efficiency factor YidD [Elusimicrobia bacterium]|nr:membrane protein insertion efficiency factor YidD [Elusimicrobiota bacterium]HBW23513.1 membrane protein insertion efficiency factor YidD [Elusimicrobiota bacterium]
MLNDAPVTAAAVEKGVNAVSAVYRFFRPLLGPRACRFHPTCSEYSFQSIKRHGILRGALLSASRIVRCHPWNPGGHDPVPPSSR